MSKHHLRGEAATLRVWLDGSELLPGPSQRIFNHSSEFNWGYGGSGPAQLACAIALALTRDKSLAVAIHQRVKDRIVVHLPGGQDFDDVWIESDGLSVLPSTTPVIEPNAQNPAAPPRSEQSYLRVYDKTDDPGKIRWESEEVTDAGV
jgi:hypothetical protein